MYNKEFGIIYQQNGKSMEQVSSNGLQLDLLASYDGTEVIKHTLAKGKRWLIGPEEGWDSLEFLYVISGQLDVTVRDEKIVLKPGDSFKAFPIKEDCIFIASKDSEFLYISSKPVFHHYSLLLGKMKQLAISVEEKDGYTADHCSRIMEYSMKLGEKLGMTSKELFQLNIGSFLHDIGKLSVPDELLKKPGKLTKEEWEIMKLHPIYGKSILIDTNHPILIEAAPIVEQHHERFDGSGYPYGLKKDEILLGAHIVAVVDSFDAMTSDRVYRNKFSDDYAISELKKGRGTLYHPDIVSTFLNMI